MYAVAAVLFFLAQPFWQTKPPEEWTFQQIGILRSNSPWAQPVGPGAPVLVYFATAVPIQEAESELRVRSKNPLREPDPDYAAYITAHLDQNFALAIPYSSLAKLGRADEQKKMEEETIMLIGKDRRYKMVGHFPPTAMDPVLRLIFRREVRPGDKSVMFRLYLPGVDFPEREIEFPVKDLMYRGKLEM